MFERLGFGIGTLLVGCLAAAALAQPSDYAFEFSVDIGSDHELSDPWMDGDEAFDPGDVYWWRSAPVDPPGRDGFKDDQFLFFFDPYPDAPDATGMTAVPVGFGSIDMYAQFFDLDAHDQIDVDFFENGWIHYGEPLDLPINIFDSACIFPLEFLFISMDDDMGPGWPDNDVPVTAPSPAGVSSYGSTGGFDEIIGLTLNPGGGPPPVGIAFIYPLLDEVNIHESLRSNPDGNEEEDDDVDSLDLVRSQNTCPFWYFSPDHEAFFDLDPGDIYQATSQGPIPIIDEVTQLGLEDDTDIDAFEFVWVLDPQFSDVPIFTLVFSVDDDDPLTPENESGGLMPNVLYGSYLTGWSFPIVEDPLFDDIDALTAWPFPLPQEPVACCLPDGSCVDLPPGECYANGGFVPPGGVCLGDGNGNGIDDACEAGTEEACCLPDGSCVYIPPSECDSSGGFIPPGGACLGDLDGNGIDDACENPGDEGCCLPDGSCVNLSPDECQQAGGFVPPGGICLGDLNGNGFDDACEEYLESPCCLPDGSCAVIPVLECIAAGGFFPPGGACLGDGNGNGIDDACESGNEEACCLPDGSCVYIPPSECDSSGGFIPPGGACLGDLNGNGIDDACEPDEKACCLPDGSCVNVPVDQCHDMGGFLPPGGVCLGDGNGNGIDDACESGNEEACCLPDGSCVYLPPSECDSSGGFIPPGGVCLGDGNGNGIDDACETPDEGCCLPDGSCVNLSPDECQQAGGFVPPGGICLGDLNGNGFDDACEEYLESPCCLPDGTCAVIPVLECIAAGGFFPPGGACLGDGNGNGIDDACESGNEEACCLPDGSCVYIPPSECLSSGGFFPPGGVCLGDGDGNGIDDACEQPVDDACCLPDGTCVVIPLDECIAMGGFVPPGGVCLGDANGNGIDDACEQPPLEYAFEFSLDIGSDIELSDPQLNGNEAADPGDVYWWQSAPIVPPGRDGFKDDRRIFQDDPWPDSPDISFPPHTRVPVGDVTAPPEPFEEWYRRYFDLDAHDQVDLSLYELGLTGEPLEQPIPRWESPCIHRPEYLMSSVDDDQAPGWMDPPRGDVPTTVPSPAGISAHGNSAARDEIVGVTLDTSSFTPPLPIISIYPIASEEEVHPSMAPNPDNGDEADDDVDSLDIVRDAETCPFWYFSADHEAFRGLEPHAVYEVMYPFGAIKVVDGPANLGVELSTDIDAFEFTWLVDADGNVALGMLFSVDEDDPITPWDESGGLHPAVIYASFLTGWHFEFSEPLEEDIDALTIWRESLEEEPMTQACCFPDGSCVDLLPDDCLAAGGHAMGVGTSCATLPPTITMPPADVVACEGDTVTLEVAACGADPKDYDWRKDNVSLGAPSAPTLTIAGVTAADMGSYDVVVTNAFGGVVSAPATLTVYLVGDANCDGVVNNFDIDAFVLALTGGQNAWEAIYACDFFCANDINRDGVVNNFDIDPFVQLLTGGPTP